MSSIKGINIAAVVLDENLMSSLSVLAISSSSYIFASEQYGKKVKSFDKENGDYTREKNSARLISHSKPLVWTPFFYICQLLQRHWKWCHKKSFKNICMKKSKQKLGVWCEKRTHTATQ